MLQKNLPRTLPPKVKTVKGLTMDIGLTSLSSKNRNTLAMQPRLHPKYKQLYTNSKELTKFFQPTLDQFNPYTLFSVGFDTVDIKGVITENGIPAVGRYIQVVLMTIVGNVMDKVYTDLEGNFVFYEVPQNLSLMAVAIDATFKYNAVILSKILTINTGEK